MKLSIKWRYGSASALFTVLFIAIIVLFGSLVGVLTDRLGLSFDMTEEGIYQLSQQTEEILQSLSDDITITVLADQNDFETVQGFAEINELLVRYSRLAGDRIKLQYVDVHKNPSYLSKYENLSGLREGAVIIESDKRYKAFQVDEFYEFETDSYTQQVYISSMVAEQKLTSGIVFVGLDSLPNLAIITGHDESVPEGFEQLLRQNNFEIQFINLLQSGFEPDTDLAVICAPQRDFSASEMAKLDSFLAEGNDLILFFDPRSQQLPVLERFAEDWGVQFSGELVVDPVRSVGELSNLSPYVIKSGLTSHLEGSTNTILMLTSPSCLKQIWEEDGYRKSTPLLRTSEQAYAKVVNTDAASTTLEKESGDLSGPFYLGLMTEERSGVDAEQRSRVLFFSSPTLVSDNFLSASNLMNRSYLSTVLSYLYDQQDQILIEPRQLESDTLAVTGFSAGIIFWVCVILLPAGVLLFGFYRWHKRRNAL